MFIRIYLGLQKAECFGRVPFLDSTILASALRQPAPPNLGKNLLSTSLCLTPLYPAYLSPSESGYPQRSEVD